MEFLIRRMDGDWFDLHYGRFPDVLHPDSFPSEQISGWGDHRIRVLGEEIAFSHEDPGIQVIFEGNLIDPEQAGQIVQEIAENIMHATGQGARIIDLG
jgi:hypothetical protein